jgi:hypothetical protein
MLWFIRKEDGWFAWNDNWYNFTQWKGFGNDTTDSSGP